MLRDSPLHARDSDSAGCVRQVSRSGGISSEPAGSTWLSDARVDPGFDVGHDLLLAVIGEQVVVVALVQLERLVRGAGSLLEEFAPPLEGDLVASSVEDEQRQRDAGEPIMEPLV